MNTLKVLSSVLLFLMLSTSCERDLEKDAAVSLGIEIDSVLQEVSPVASIRKLTLDTKREINCLVDTIMTEVRREAQEKEGKSSLKDKDIDRRVDELLKELHEPKERVRVQDEKLGSLQEFESQVSAKEQETNLDIDIKSLENELTDHFLTSCEFYKQITEMTYPVFDKIKELGEVPTGMYVFSIFEESDYQGSPVTYVEQELGWFSSKESCVEMEELARSISFPTRKCQEY